MHMTPQGPKDPELRYFADNLKRKPEGERYVTRWAKLQNCRQALITADKNAPGLELVRQSYIRLCDSATSALMDLERQYNWPR